MATQHPTSSSSPAVKLDYFESGVALITLSASGEKTVTLTPERLDSLKDALARIQGAKGLVIAGPSAEMFTVGADVNLIRQVTDPVVGEELARRGQEVFNLIAALPFPTVAAISGPCVGGGCELVLACRYRIMSDDKSSMIGLPEIKLGILPGFGGTQRLPRLIGLPKALDIILAGKTLRPRQALTAGLVSEVIQYSRLLERADSIASGAASTHEPRLGFTDKFFTWTKIGRSFVKGKVRKSIQKETSGFYPAPPSALDATLLGLEQGMEIGLRYEARELGRLIDTPESKSLVKVIFLSEASKALGKSARKDVEHISGIVIGAGTMGAGIAGVLAKSGCSVILKDSSDSALARGKEHIMKFLSRLKYLSETEKSFILNRIETTTRESINSGNVNFVVEAVFEDLSLKQRLLTEVAATVAEEAIIATNTSSLSVTKIAAGIPQPERVIGMHFFNPVEKMPLVEIVMGEKTTDRTIAVVAALTTRLGKYPIVVKDVPGFLVNRILSPYLTEAAHLLSEGYSVEDIDNAALRFGMPMGPLRLLDEVGLDVATHVSEIMVQGYGDRMKGPSFSRALAEAGRKGKKSGGGFYDFEKSGAKPCEGLRELLKISPPVKRISDLTPLTERLIFSLLNEGIRCLDEGVAGAPGVDAANQINLGTVMGMGFPPFRGGLLTHADSVGAKGLLDGFNRLQKDVGPRFAPVPGIAKRAESGKTFCG